jgi:hypothetical protein
MLFTVPSTGGLLRKPYSALVLKIHTQKIRETRKLECSHVQHSVEWKNEGRKLWSEKTRVYAQKPRLKMPFQEFHLSVWWIRMFIPDPGS